MFEHDLTYDIYRDDITFIDHISTLPGGSMVTHGKARTSAPRALFPVHSRVLPLRRPQNVRVHSRRGCIAYCGAQIGASGPCECHVG